jgi:sirohydrochlorin cobaltochelatase
MVMSDNDLSTGLLLVGHGTRSAVGTQQYLALARSLAERLAPLAVEPAFLELQQPDIHAAVARLVSRGIHRLVTMPLLLFAAGHAKRDVPRQVTAALTRCGQDQIEQIQAPHLGCHSAIVELSRRRMEESLFSTQAATGSRDAEIQLPSCLLLVARGSQDDSAAAEMHDFARIRQQDMPEVSIDVAFLAMARPLLGEKLTEIACRGYERVVVQPHFLFHGELVESIASQVADVAVQHPDQEWIVAPPLADNPDGVTSATEVIQKVILDRCDQAGIRVVATASGD